MYIYAHLYVGWPNDIMNATDAPTKPLAVAG